MGTRDQKVYEESIETSGLIWFRKLFFFIELEKKKCLLGELIKKMVFNFISKLKRNNMVSFVCISLPPHNSFMIKNSLS